MSTTDGIPAYPVQPPLDAFDGRVIVTWPFKREAVDGLPGWGISIHDAETGEQIYTVIRFGLVFASAEDMIWLEAVAYADAEGRLRRNLPAVIAECDLRTAVFRFLVTEMRVAEAGQ